jgi:hypothetical protein
MHEVLFESLETLTLDSGHKENSFKKINFAVSAGVCPPVETVKKLVF